MGYRCGCWYWKVRPLEKKTKEKLPRGRRKADAVPKIEEICQKEKDAEDEPRKNSCIVLISNVGEDVAGNRELVQT